MNANHPVEIEFAVDKDVQLKGLLHTPPDPHGVILFAHGSGSSRFSSRNNEIARLLAAHGFAAVLVDLLTASEDQIDAITRELRFNIPLLADRVVATIDWLRRDPTLAALPIGLFGSSTGAAAALCAATERPGKVSAIVSRGGRPDLAFDSLKLVRAPTLLIVGSEDPQVLELNRYAAACMWAPIKVTVVEGASHLFEETGTLAQAALHALGWFEKYLTVPPSLPSIREDAARTFEAPR